MFLVFSRSIESLVRHLSPKFAYLFTVFRSLILIASQLRGFARSVEQQEKNVLNRSINEYQSEIIY